MNTFGLLGRTVLILAEEASYILDATCYMSGEPQA